MKVVQYGPGEIAWLEPENDQDEELIEKSKKENWSTERLLGEAATCGRLSAE